MDGWFKWNFLWGPGLFLGNMQLSYEPLSYATQGKATFTTLPPTWEPKSITRMRSWPPAHETWRWRLKFSQQTWQQKNTWLKVLDASSRFERERPLNKRFNGVVHDDMPRKNIKWVSWENEGAWVWNYLQDSPAAWFFSIHHHINWCISNFYNVFQNPVFSQINLHQ